MCNQWGRSLALRSSIQSSVESDQAFNGNKVALATESRNIRVERIVRLSARTQELLYRFQCTYKAVSWGPRALE